MGISEVLHAGYRSILNENWGQAPAFRIITDDACQAPAFGNAEALDTVAPNTALSLTRCSYPR